MTARIPISRASRDDVTYPAEPSAGANPYTGRHDQPEYPAKYLAIVDLPYAWNEQAQNGSDPWVSHVVSA